MELGDVLTALIGGSLIGLAVSVMLLVNGRVTGVSGITSGALDLRNLKRGDFAWRWAFVLGLVSGGAVLLHWHPEALMIQDEAHLGVLALAGFLVGFGALLGNGCTSGHGICGMSRLSPRSIAATASFMLAGIITVALLRLWMRG